MQKQFEATDRAWITVIPSVATPLTFDGQVHIGFNFHVANIGKSPAQNVEVLPELFYGMEYKKLADRQKAICSGPAAMEKVGVPPLPSPGYTVFPGDSFTSDTYILGGPMDEFNATNARLQRDGNQKITIYSAILTVCVDYTFGPGTRHHQTSADFDLLMKGRNQIFSVIPLSEAPIPAESLSAVPSRFGIHFAN